MGILSLIKTANHNLWRNKLRTILTILAIFVGAFTVALVVAMNTGMNNYLDKQLDASVDRNSITILPEDPMNHESDNTGQASSKNAEKSDFSDSDINAIKGIEGVTEIEIPNSISIDSVSLQGSDDKFKNNTNFSRPTKTVSLDIGYGKMPNNDNDELVITDSWALPKFFDLGDPQNLLEKKVDFTVKNFVGESKTFTATIVGVINKSLLSRSEGYFSQRFYDDMRQWWNIGNKFADQKPSYLQAITIPEKNKEVATAISELGFYVMTAEASLGDARTVVDTGSMVLIGFALIALLAAAFGIANTLYMSVLERTREIGLNKAMGLSNFKTFATFAFEAILIGFWGSLIAVLAAMASGETITQLAGTRLSNLPGLNLFLWTPINVAQVMGLIMLITFISGALPSIRAARRNPIDALRYE